MTVYTYSEARQRLAEVLDKVIAEGRVQIRRRDGSVFTITPEEAKGSPFDIEGITTDVTTSEMISMIRESRERRYE